MSSPPDYVSMGEGFYCPYLPNSDVFCPIPRKPHSNGALRQYLPDAYISFDTSEPAVGDYVLEPAETTAERVTAVSDVGMVKAKELEASPRQSFSREDHEHALGAADEPNRIASWTDLEIGTLSIVKESYTSGVKDGELLDFNRPWNDSEFQTLNSTLWQGEETWDKFDFYDFSGIGHPDGQQPSYTNSDTITTRHLAEISMKPEPTRHMYKSTAEEIYKSEDHAKLLPLFDLSGVTSGVQSSPMSGHAGENACQVILSQDTSSPTTDSNESKFSCGITGCGKLYNRSYELRRHQRTHSTIRAHSCAFPTCHKSGRNGFVRKDHLKQHMRQVHKV